MGEESKGGIEMSEMMSYKKCLEYVMDMKLSVWHDKDGVWTVSGLQGETTRSIDAPDYEGAVNTWKANYGDTPCDPAK